MGLCGSKYKPSYKIPGTVFDVMPMALELGYSRGDVDKMFGFFNSCDIDRSGLVSIREMNAINRINNKKFGNLIFRLFDKDNTGEVTFEEFLIAAYGSLSLDDCSLATFAFRLFDEDNSGTLSAREIQNLIEIVCGSNTKSCNHAAQELKKFDSNGDGIMTLNEFLRMTDKSKIILFPAFEMRDILRNNSLGKRRWRSLTAQRKMKDGARTIFEIVPLLKARPTSYKEKDISHAQKCMRSAGYLQKSRTEGTKSIINQIEVPGGGRRNSRGSSRGSTSNSWKDQRKKSEEIDLTKVLEAYIPSGTRRNSKGKVQPGTTNVDLTAISSDVPAAPTTGRRNSKGKAQTPRGTQGGTQPPRATTPVPGPKGGGGGASVLSIGTAPDLRLIKPTNGNMVPRGSHSVSPNRKSLTRQSLDGGLLLSNTAPDVIAANGLDAKMRRKSVDSVTATAITKNITATGRPKNIRVDSLRNIAKRDVQAAMLAQVADRVSTSSTPKPIKSSFS